MNDKAIVSTQLDNGIYTVIMDRACTKNAINPEMMANITTAIKGIYDPDVKVMIIKGADNNFISGADIKYFKNLSSKPSSEHMIDINDLLTSAQKLIRMIYEAEKPVIAAVEGAAVGFGLSIVAACDFAIAVNDSIFSTAYTGIGLSPDGGISYILPRVLGIKKAKELLMLSERFSAEKAKEYGLVNTVVTAEEFDQSVNSLAQHLRSSALCAIKETKKLINQALESSLVEQLDKEQQAIFRSLQTKDFNIGVDAFLTKEKPRFIGK